MTSSIPSVLSRLALLFPWLALFPPRNPRGFFLPPRGEPSFLQALPLLSVISLSLLLYQLTTPGQPFLWPSVLSRGPRCPVPPLLTPCMWPYRCRPFFWPTGMLGCTSFPLLALPSLVLPRCSSSTLELRPPPFFRAIPLLWASPPFICGRLLPPLFFLPFLGPTL